MTSQALITASAAIILTLGLLHLLYTFRGPKLHPREAALETQMKVVSPVITRQTTMWKAWVGFNASLTSREFLFESRFLCVLGLLFLSGYVVLGRLYWFSVPFRGIVIATVCYIAGLVVAWT